MAAEAMRTSFFLSRGLYGWSYSFDHSLTDDYELALARAKRIIPKLRKVHGQTVSCTYVRVSKVWKPKATAPADYKGDSRIYTVGFNGKPDGAMEGSPQSDIPNTCLLLRFDLGALHRRAMYLRGIPDAVWTAGFDVATMDPQFKDDVEALGQKLIDEGYGAIIKDKQPGPNLGQPALKPFDKFAIIRMTHRDTGRPFDSPRGRRKRPAPV